MEFVEDCCNSSVAWFEGVLAFRWGFATWSARNLQNLIDLVIYVAIGVSREQKIVISIIKHRCIIQTREKNTDRKEILRMAKEETSRKKKHMVM